MAMPDSWKFHVVYYSVTKTKLKRYTIHVYSEVVHTNIKKAFCCSLTKLKNISKNWIAPTLSSWQGYPKSNEGIDNPMHEVALYDYL